MRRFGDDRILYDAQVQKGNTMSTKRYDNNDAPDMIVTMSKSNLIYVSIVLSSLSVLLCD